MMLPAAQSPASSADETKMSPNGVIFTANNLHWNDIHGVIKTSFIQEFKIQMYAINFSFESQLISLKICQCTLLSILNITLVQHRQNQDQNA